MCPRLVRYYENKHFGQTPGLGRVPVAACITLLIATLLCAAFLGIAARVTQRAGEIEREQRREFRRHYPQPIYRNPQPDVPVE